MNEDSYSLQQCPEGTTCSACGGTLWPHSGPMRMGLLVNSRFKVKGWIRVDGKVLAIGVHPTVCSIECMADLNPEWRKEGESAS